MPIQNSAKGNFAKQRVDAVTTLKIGVHSITDDGTHANFDGGVKVNALQGLVGVATGLKFSNPNTSLPGNVNAGVVIGMLTNSTGRALVINTGGTTWKYLNVTTKQPT